MPENNKLSIYLGGDIMSFGSNLARQYEYDKFREAGIPANVYSPVMNKSINDKSNMTEQENNVLAEKITSQDIERLWNSDIVVMCPEQNAIGSLCEMGCLFGWKYVGEEMMKRYETAMAKCTAQDIHTPDEVIKSLEHELAVCFVQLMYVLKSKEIYAHYFDIRTNHLNEKDWRRSFSINQLLYGMILYATEDHELHSHFDEVLSILKQDYEQKDNEGESDE